jgi:hypothetical protein
MLDKISYSAEPIQTGEIITGMIPPAHKLQLEREAGLGIKYFKLSDIEGSEYFKSTDLKKAAIQWARMIYGRSASVHWLTDCQFQVLVELKGGQILPINRIIKIEVTE